MSTCKNCYQAYPGGIRCTNCGSFFGRYYPFEFYILISVILIIGLVFMACSGLSLAAWIAVQPLPTATPLPTSTPSPTVTPEPGSILPDIIQVQTTPEHLTRSSPIDITALDGWLTVITQNLGQSVIYRTRPGSINGTTLADVNSAIQARWNLAGTNILFSAESNHVRSIFMASNDKTCPISNGLSPSTSPIWSPDNQQVAYIQDGQIQIEPATCDQTQPGVTFTPVSNIISFDWSSYNIFAIIAQSGDQRALFLHNILTRELVRTNLSGQIRSPMWSPDGNFLAYILADEKGEHLYLLDLRTQVSRLIGSGSGLSTPTWSPDSSRILYVVEQDQQQYVVLANPGEGWQRQVNLNLQNIQSITWNR